VLPDRLLTVCHPSVKLLVRRRPCLNWFLSSGGYLGGISVQSVKSGRSSGEERRPEHEGTSMWCSRSRWTSVFSSPLSGVRRPLYRPISPADLNILRQSCSSLHAQSLLETCRVGEWIYWPLRYTTRNYKQLHRHR
jgi:hypothetical protein